MNFTDRQIALILFSLQESARKIKNLPALKNYSLNGEPITIQELQEIYTYIQKTEIEKVDL